MGLKAIFNIRRSREAGTATTLPRIEAYLMKKQEEASDRAPNVISPSSVGYCIRAQVIGRFLPRAKVDPRVQRIFDNGTYVGMRIQEYYRKAKMLLMEEAPLYNAKYNVQGHADGLIYTLGNIPDGWWSEAVVRKYDEVHEEFYWHPNLDTVYRILRENPLKRIEVLEIKSINSRQFSALRDAKEEHKDQATTYSWLCETRRKELHKKYPNWDSFIASEDERRKEHGKRFAFLPKRKRVRKENECLLRDAILYATQTPVERVVFAYENKDNQQAREFAVRIEEARLEKLKKEFKMIEESVAKIRSKFKGEPDFTSKKVVKLLPPKPSEATSRSCEYCKWCDYRNICWPRGAR